MAKSGEKVPDLLKLSVGLTGQVYLLEIEGLFTQGSQPGRTVGGSVDGMFEMDCSDWSNGIRYHVVDTRPDTEFKCYFRYRASRARFNSNGNFRRYICADS